MWSYSPPNTNQLRSTFIEWKTPSAVASCSVLNIIVYVTDVYCPLWRLLTHGNHVCWVWKSERKCLDLLLYSPCQSTLNTLLMCSWISGWKSVIDVVFHKQDSPSSHILPHGAHQMVHASWCLRPRLHSSPYWQGTWFYFSSPINLQDLAEEMA